MLFYFMYLFNLLPCCAMYYSGVYYVFMFMFKWVTGIIWFYSCYVLDSISANTAGDKEMGRGAYTKKTLRKWLLFDPSRNYLISVYLG